MRVAVVFICSTVTVVSTRAVLALVYFMYLMLLVCCDGILYNT